jgi:PAS domain S-box-containing protein
MDDTHKTKEELIAELAALRQRNSELEFECRSAQAEVKALYEMSYHMNTAQDEATLLEVLARPAVDAGAVRANLFYIDLDKAGQPEWMELAAVFQTEGEPPVPVGTRFHLPEYSLLNFYLSSPDKPLLIADTVIDDRIDDTFRKLLLRTGARAMVVVPLVQTGRWVGVVSFIWTKLHQFDEHEVVTYHLMSGLISPAIESRRLIKNLEKMVAARTIEHDYLLNSIQDAVIHVDLKGTIRSWNRGAERLYGWTAAEAIGQNINITVRPEDRASQVEQTIKPTFDTGSHEGEYKRIGKDGRELMVRISLSLMHDETSEPVGISGVITDITAQVAQRQVQQQLIAAQQQAIRDLTTPIIPLLEGIILLPLIGTLDAVRVQQMTRALLAGVGQYRAKIVILDITGVPTVDEEVAIGLDRVIQAVRLKGGRTIITGISDTVAETVVELGINWGEVGRLTVLLATFGVFSRRAKPTRKPYPI